ncbi:hypothetical protein ACQPZP_01640 [Spirillospora sp. CA-142024]|uniref:hypothetical protein n=1 Tax=Spirillospora sp. CA-142024 TaxID=3240036 RepID=UPI003D92FC05
MAVRKSSAMITLVAAAATTTTFAIPHQAAAAPSPAPSAQSARNRYPHGLRQEAVTEPGHRTAKTRRLASKAADGVKVVINVLDRNGKPPATDDANGVTFYPLDGSDPFYGELDTGNLEGRLPAGEYAVMAYVKTPEGDGDASTTLIYRPRVRVQDATKLVLDAREARPVSVSVYNVVAEQRERIPANPEFRVKTADMAKVRVRYGTEGRPVCTGGHAAPAWAEGGGIGFFSGVGAAPATRTEYFTPGVAWDIDWMNTTPDCGFEFDKTEIWNRTVRFTKPGSHRWKLTPAPFGPARPVVIWGSGEEPALAVPMHSTWDGRSDLAPYNGASGSSVLRDSTGRVVYESDQPGTAHGWPVTRPGTTR